MPFDRTGSADGEPTNPAKVVAVTGASGLIGRRLMPMLAASPCEVRALTRSGSLPEGVTAEVGDLSDNEALAKLVAGADTVIHLAGFAHTDLRNEALRAEAFAVNVTGTQALLRAAKVAGVSHFILISSAHVYADQRGIYLSEEATTADDGGYAGMKLAAEATANAAAADSMTITILRPCLTYGPGVRANLAALLNAVRRRRYVHARGVEVIRSMASVDTVAAAILHVATERIAGTYNVADRNPVLLEAWVNQLSDKLGVQRPHAVPLMLLRALATAGSATAALGLPAPLTRVSLGKLLTSFSLNVDKLAATGFEWPQTEAVVIDEMIAASMFSPKQNARM